MKSSALFPLPNQSASIAQCVLYRVGEEEMISRTDFNKLVWTTEEREKKWREKLRRSKKEEGREQACEKQCKQWNENH